MAYAMRVMRTMEPSVAPTAIGITSFVGFSGFVVVVVVLLGAVMKVALG